MLSHTAAVSELPSHALPCCIALEPPESLPNCSLDLASQLKVSKAFLNFNAPKKCNAVECVQCAETFYSHNMSHCVPEWDVAGGELDVGFEPPDPSAPNAGKWESGQPRTHFSETAFVPDQEFEELCWEDGQLVVMQSQCNKNRSWPITSPLRFNSENVTATRPSVVPVADLDSTLDTLGIVVSGSCAVNSSTQEDELLSWLQHPFDESVEKYCPDVLSDTPNAELSFENCENMCPIISVHHGALPNTLNSGRSTTGADSKNCGSDASSQPTSAQTCEGDSSKHINGAQLAGGFIGSKITPSAKKLRHRHGCRRSTA